MFVVSFASPSVTPVRGAPRVSKALKLCLPRRQQPVAMMLHELVANAAK
jgi:two-component sensor histidine kinase